MRCLQCHYEARAHHVKLEDVTSSDKNAEILRRLRDGHSNESNAIFILWEEEVEMYEENEDNDLEQFVVRDEDDLGWLGYFIGESEVLEELDLGLHFDYLPEEVERISALMEGISRNQSIRTLRIAVDLGDQGFEYLGHFLRNCKNLSHLDCHFDIGRERAHNIALALGQRRHKSLRTLVFGDCNLSAEALAEISSSLISLPELIHLCLHENNIGRNGCIALENTMSTSHAPELQRLYVGYNAIDDEGLQALVTGMRNCRNLESLGLSGNDLITAAGLRSLSTLFQSETCSLQTLFLKDMNIGDDGAAALADGLVGNKSLNHLHFDPDVAGITEVGWSAFSKLLCDTSSINSTYTSNHTLEIVGDEEEELRGTTTPPDVEKYLRWNERLPQVAICKILSSHADLEMEPFFQWKLKFLPLVVTWFEESIGSIAAHLAEISISVCREGSSDRASSWEITASSQIIHSYLKIRKLSAIYKFVRGLPMELLEHYQSQTATTMSSRKLRLDGESK